MLHIAYIALSVVVVLVSVILFLMSATTLWWMLHAWRSPEEHEGISCPDVDRPRLSFSIIVPCREEEEGVMWETVRRLLMQDHPDFEVIISVGHDDLATIGNARRIAARDRRIRVSVNTDPVKNKPRQLNSSLRECTKQIVGIIDAESLTAPGLLRRIDTTFRREYADVVQGAVHLVTLRDRWFSLRNCLEYRIWFRSRLHGHARNGFIPLGGNTVFTKRQVLLEANGWDANCLAEDCEIGVRLSVGGRKTVCVYEPELTTQEETPSTTRAFVKQRTRWSLGFMQVFAKGEWKALPGRRLRLGAAWLLTQQYTVAFAGLVFPLAVATAIFNDLPDVVVLVSFLPLMPTALTLVFEMLILHEFGHDLRLRVRFWDYVWLVLSTPFYQALLAFAALRACVKYMTKDFGWEKTGHKGAHVAQPVMTVRKHA
jgi:cellulose synthase/poly-beta-1,6-N-acetylglucosamine synthase-like glycosyltransferase